MVANIKDKAVIVGVGNTEFSKNSGVSELNLAIQACKAACDDKGAGKAGLPGNADVHLGADQDEEEQFGENPQPL